MRFAPAARGVSVSSARGIDGASQVSRASLRTAVAVGQTSTYKFVVHADAPGTMQVTARVNVPVSADRTDAAQDDVFLTVGSTDATSRIGAAPAPTSGTAVAVPGSASVAPQRAERASRRRRAVGPAAVQ